MPIPYGYVSQANASEAEPEEQAMGNNSVETREIFSGVGEIPSPLDFPVSFGNSESDVTRGISVANTALVQNKDQRTVEHSTSLVFAGRSNVPVT